MNTTAQTTLTAAANQAAPLGSAMAELLAQVPGPLAEQIRDAWADDLTRIYRHGLTHGSSNAFTAVEEELDTRQPCRPYCINHITTFGDGELCNSETVTLDFDRPDLPAGSITSATLTLGYSDDEGDNITIGLADSETVYMTAGDFHALATAGLKLIGDTDGGSR